MIPNFQRLGLIVAANTHIRNGGAKAVIMRGVDAF